MSETLNDQAVDAAEAQDQADFEAEFAQMGCAAECSEATRGHLLNTFLSARRHQRNKEAMQRESQEAVAELLDR